MSFLDAFQISASGLSAERLRVNVISSNIANVNTTRTKEGGPYKKKEVVFEAVPIEKKSFEDNLKEASDLREVKVTEIVEDNSPPVLKYDPSHPDANADGYVAYPNINLMEEMVDLINASRSYQANVTAMKATKDMAMKSVEILRA